MARITAGGKLRKQLLFRGLRRDGHNNPHVSPLQQRGKAAAVWRGGSWYPTFSYTENGRDWVPARELVRSAQSQRPYAKYVGDGETNIHGIYANGHFTSGGASLDHEDPRVVHPSRTISECSQVERWFTPDDSRTWTTQRLIGDSTHTASGRWRPAGSRAPSGSCSPAATRPRLASPDYRTRIRALDF